MLRRLNITNRAQGDPGFPSEVVDAYGLIDEIADAVDEIGKYARGSGVIDVWSLPYLIGSKFEVPNVVGNNSTLTVQELASDGQFPVLGYGNKTSTNLLGQIQADFPGVESLNTTLDTAYLLRAFAIVNTGQIRGTAGVDLGAGRQYNINQTLKISRAGFKLIGASTSNDPELGTLVKLLPGLNINALEKRIPDGSNGRGYAHHTYIGEFRIVMDYKQSTEGNGIVIFNAGEASVINRMHVSDAPRAGILFGSAPTPGYVANSQCFSCENAFASVSGSQRNVMIVKPSGDDNKRLIYNEATNMLILSPKVESGYQSNPRHRVMNYAKIKGLGTLTTINGYFSNKNDNYYTIDVNGKQVKEDFLVHIESDSPRPTVHLKNCTVDGFRYAVYEERLDKKYSLDADDSFSLFPQNVDVEHDNKGRVTCKYVPKKAFTFVRPTTDVSWNALLDRDVIIYNQGNTNNTIVLNPFYGTNVKDSGGDHPIVRQLPGGRITVISPNGATIKFADRYPVQHGLSAYPYVMNSGNTVNARVVLNYYFSSEGLCISSAETRTMNKPNYIVNPDFGRSLSGWDLLTVDGQDPRYCDLKQSAIIDPNGSLSARIGQAFTLPNLNERTVRVRLAVENITSLPVQVIIRSGNDTSAAALVTNNSTGRAPVQQIDFTFTPTQTNNYIEIVGAAGKRLLIESIEVR